MGILASSDGSPSPFLRFFGWWSNPLCFLLYLVGVGYFATLLYPSFSAKTYFSENALLPGLVDEEFSRAHTVAKLGKALKDQAENHDDDIIPYDYIRNAMASVGLETHVQNFTVYSHPFGFPSDLVGHNVYGVVRAPRGSSDEALVVAVPYRPNAYGAIPLMIGLAAFCREQIYWAKDLIFLVTEHEELGMQAWLNSYHQRENERRAGAIQAAVVLEVDGSTVGPFTHADVRFNMVNGQLPNLDLVNLVVKMVEKEALEPTIFRRSVPGYRAYTSKGYVETLKVAAMGLTSQATGSPTGLHSLFGSFGIEAVSVEPYLKGRGPRGDDYATGLNEIGKILEGILRSLNNLLERFHQSFFFYILMDPHRYVSIGLYMPAVALILLAPLLKAYSLWSKVLSEETKDSEEEKHVHFAPKKPKQGELLLVMPYVVMAYFLGFLAYMLPDLLGWLHRRTLQVPSQHLFSTVALGLVLPLCMFPVLMARNFGTQRNADTPLASPVLLRCVLLVQLSLILGVISMLNFGLGFLLAVVQVPVYLLVANYNCKICWLLSTAAALLANPLMLLLAAHLGLAAAESSEPIDTTWFMDNVAEVARESFVSVIFDSIAHGSWLFSLLTLGLLPPWVLLWTLLQQPARS